MDDSTLDRIAEFICGNGENHPEYRSSSKITSFFERSGLPQFIHDGSTRQWWVHEKLKECNREQLAAVLKRLSSPKEYKGDRDKIKSALTILNEILYVEGFKIKLEGLEPKFEKFDINFSDENVKTSSLSPMPAPDFMALGLESEVGKILVERWEEAQRCVDSKAHLSAIIIMGSMLEGLLLGVLQRNPGKANLCSTAPKDSKSGKVKSFAHWKLAEMIDVAHNVGWLGMDVRQFSHALRGFRNLIHPYEQMASKMYPDADTCDISWLVVQAAVNDLARALKNDSTLR
ncbi:MAG: hypothetical protein ACTIMZ_08575 [Pseudoalteromonas distincta]|uniref:hypothetical protein n=1 Tax=Pseudoalteromonas distincta TaxID=77608 RepID=UPI003F99250C